MSSMTQKTQSRIGAEATPAASHETPKKGDRFHCQQCGMEIQVTADCKCHGPEHVHFQCCGEEMHYA